jgi:thiamine-monophosphate kinase
MKISELGGEFALIDRIARIPRGGNVVKGIGDDCAVIRISDSLYHLYTIDMLVEGDHFSMEYFSPYDVGYKAMISNVSDIASCGGKVLYALISFSITDSIDVGWIDEFYRGVYEVCDRFSFDLIGGDTTHGKIFTISITLVGEVTPPDLRLRSMAKPGDLIALSAPIGGSTAGLRLFLKGSSGFENVKQYHLHPQCGMDQLVPILPISKAMTDVSDGLASEVRNICRESNVGAHIVSSSVPLSPGIRESAHLLGDNPLDYALFGGEDFALVYTVSPENADLVSGAIVGEIVSGSGVFLDGRELVRFGYDHFGGAS